MINSTVKTVIKFIIILLSLFVSVNYSPEGIASDPINLEKKFYEKFNSLPPIKRDDFLDTYLNTMVNCNGSFISADSSSRYGKDMRIVLADMEALKYNMHIRWYVFMESRQKKKLKLSKNDILKFRGSFAAYTPLNTSRNEYIFDIILTDDTNWTD